MSFKQSDSFKVNRFVWKIFGLYPGRKPNKRYKYFSFFFVFTILVTYNMLLALNLYYTPRKIDLLIREYVFSFMEIAIFAKVSMILFKKKKIDAVFVMLDSVQFQGNDYTGWKTVKQHNSKFKKYAFVFALYANFTFFTLFIFKLIGFFLSGGHLDLPVCQYYFLSNETRSDYFVYIFIYQSVGMYVHMMYNVNTDSLIVGFLVLAIAQVRVLQHDLENLKMEMEDAGTGRKEAEHRLLEKLNRSVKHYALVIKYCRAFEDVIGIGMFVQFGVGSANICVNLCGLLLPWTMETTIFLVPFFFAISLEIFVPAYLGTQLTYESQTLMRAAYKSEWIPRPRGYKKSLRLFVERAKEPIVIRALQMFPLALSTYLSIMKAAYSCFTLVRYFVDRQEHA